MCRSADTGSALAVVNHQPATVGNHNVDLHIVGLGGYIVGYELEIVAYAYLGGFGAAEHSIIISFASTHAVAHPVESHARHNDKLDSGDVGGVVALRLLDVECAHGHVRAVVGEYVKVHPVDSR